MWVGTVWEALWSAARGRGESLSVFELSCGCLSLRVRARRLSRMECVREREGEPRRACCMSCVLCVRGGRAGALRLQAACSSSRAAAAAAAATVVALLSDARRLSVVAPAPLLFLQRLSIPQNINPDLSDVPRGSRNRSNDARARPYCGARRAAVKAERQQHPPSLPPRKHNIRSCPCGATCCWPPWWASCCCGGVCRCDARAREREGATRRELDTQAPLVLPSVAGLSFAYGTTPRPRPDAIRRVPSRPASALIQLAPLELTRVLRARRVMSHRVAPARGIGWPLRDGAAGHRRSPRAQARLPHPLTSREQHTLTPRPHHQKPPSKIKFPGSPPKSGAPRCKSAA